MPRFENITPDDTKDPKRLYQRLRSLVDALNRFHHETTAPSTSPETAAQRVITDTRSRPVTASTGTTSPAPTDTTGLTLAEIRTGLSARGSAPLNVAALLGKLAEPQLPEIIIFTTSPPSGASTYPLGVLAVTTDTTPEKLWYVKRDTNGAHIWEQIEVGPANYVTTNTSQTVGPGAPKSWSDLQTFLAGIRINGGGLLLPNGAGGITVQAGGGLTAVQALTVALTAVITGATTINNTLAVTGVATMAGINASGAIVANNSLAVNGPMALAYRTDSNAAVTGAITDNIVHCSNAAARTYTLNGGCADSQVITIKDSAGTAGGAAITIAAGGATTLEAAMSISNNYGYLTVQLVGTVWRRIG